MRTIAVLLVLVSSIGVAPAEPSEGELEERTKARLREVRLRVRPAAPAGPGACDGLGLDELKVSVRGEPVARELLLELEREQRPTLHALLIDTSRSAAGKLDYFRSAATEYVKRLRPGLDSALVATFDESVVLVQPQTSDQTKLIEAIESVRMGDATALNDGLYYIMRELEAHRERPVVLLITDGFDTASLHSRDDVYEQTARRPEQTVFTIGFAVPPVMAGGPPGLASTPRFLQRIATRTNGSYIDVFTGGRLAGAFDRIRGMLEQEAILTFLDPDPEAEPGRIKVSSRNPDCGIRLFRSEKEPEDQARHRPTRPPHPGLPHTLPLTAPEAYTKYYRGSGKKALDPDCRPPTPDTPDEALWFLDVEPHGVRGCALDITMETGQLYDAESVLRVRGNAWLKQKTRPVEFEVPPPGELPTRVVEIMPALADAALGVADDEIETDPRQVPVELHARPYHDLAMIGHGKVFFELRPTLSRALYAYPEYRAWVREKLEQEARSELAALKERFRAHALAGDEATLDEAVRLSRAGQEIRRRAERPTEVDLQEYLAAWLGDISAHELFVRWEAERINRLLEEDDAAAFDGFRERWSATRRLFFVPSYARILTLWAPVRDPDRERIGYWRVVLPRASWMLRRVKGYRKRPDYADLPMDLLPDLPLALWAVERARDEDPELREALSTGGHRAVEVRYVLLGKPYRHDPRRGFRQTRVEVRFRDAGDTGNLRLTAEITLHDGEPRLESRDVSYPDSASRSDGTR